MAFVLEPALVGEGIECLADGTELAIGRVVVVADVVGVAVAVVVVVLDRADVAVVLALEDLRHLLTEEQRTAERGAVGITVDPGIGEIEIGQTAVLAVGDVQSGIPGPAQQVGVLHLHLTEHTLALAVSEAAGQLSC